LLLGASRASCRDRADAAVYRLCKGQARPGDNGRHYTTAVLPIAKEMCAALDSLTARVRCARRPKPAATGAAIANPGGAEVFHGGTVAICTPAHRRGPTEALSAFRGRGTADTMRRWLVTGGAGRGRPSRGRAVCMGRGVREFRKYLSSEK